MKQDKYFVIIGSQDGGCSIREMTKEKILKMMIPGKYGDYEYGDGKFLDELPEDICNFDDIVIIKGQIVVPKPKQTVTEYELD